ncbi:uncharacterized protein Z519_06710 [Cladophialophora bantiana CBS 173.52]|uniref:Uncharacterized protein n=1 Tax=Cladophialophora bantiana (strain ATCC 10958 / CBS 173.52 / CDC B-1940 / NIH 8579) TaxID=1442370 RepID=A0A0D2ESK7_CLAB1|nr:uncharacterized protein Z519_06710 [Cladophialophora bantiana CBS 173.52]KIW92861.1 hypothetical protein Z519_06710 [Cladophialophora bantiana CBS 173.52]
MEDLQCDQWKNAELASRLKRRLCGEGEFENYQFSVYSVHENINKMAEKLKSCEPLQMGRLTKASNFKNSGASSNSLSARRGSKNKLLTWGNKSTALASFSARLKHLRRRDNHVAQRYLNIWSRQRNKP